MKTHENRHVEALLTGRLHIDAWDALEAYAKYQEQLAYLRAGGSYAELGFGESRRAARPQFVLSDETGHAFEVRAEETLDPQITPRGDINGFADGKKVIAMLTLSGVMRSESGPSAPGVAQLADQIMMLGNDPAVSGILLRVRSGGGESMSADLLRVGIQGSRAPVVVLADRMGSAAVYGTLDAAEIIASSDRARVGSIGSLISVNSKLLKQYSKEVVDHYSDLSPDKNLEFRELLKGNLEPLLAMVRTDAEEFREDVRRHRPLQGSAATVEKTLSGGMFAAQEAKARGLVDGVGGLAYVIRRVRSYAR